MSVPAERMAPRNPAMPMKDPNKIMGLDKKVFWVVVILGLLLAYYIYKRSTNSAANASVGTSPDGGLTAADIGGTPGDNSFATQTDADALESQIQALQSSLGQLSTAPPGSTTGSGVDPGTTGDNSGGDTTSSQGDTSTATWGAPPPPSAFTTVESGGSLIPLNNQGNTIMIPKLDKVAS